MKIVVDILLDFILFIFITIMLVMLLRVILMVYFSVVIPPMSLLLASIQVSNIVKVSLRSVRNRINIFPLRSRYGGVVKWLVSMMSENTGVGVRDK